MRMLRQLMIGGTVAALLTVSVAALAVRAADPEPADESMARMTQMMGEMHRVMQEMHKDMQPMPGTHGMHGRMGHTMGMMEQMRGMMGEHREQMREQCPMMTPAPRQDG